MIKYYSAPNFGNPQELPERWRFDDGTVRTDLRTLNDEELRLLDWVPVEVPIARQIDEDGNIVTEGDYNPETHKFVWYPAQRRYVILEKDADTGPYESGNHVSPLGQVADWNGFRIALVSSATLNTFIASVMNVAPLAALALPATITNIEKEGFANFAAAWNAITSAVDEVPEELIQEVVSAAEQYNLPFEFIRILWPQP